MRLISICMMMALCLTACTKEPHEVKLATNADELAKLTKYVEKNLEGEDKEIAKQILVQNAMGLTAGKMFGMNLSTDNVITLGEAMDKQKAQIAKEKAFKEKNQKVIDEMNSVLEVSYLSHDKLDYGRYNFSLQLRNKKPPKITAIKGYLVFYDKHGDKVGRIEVKHDEPIIFGYFSRINQLSAPSYSLDETFKDGEYSSSDVKFEPISIAFEGGKLIQLEQHEPL